MSENKFWQAYFTIPSVRSNGMQYRANKYCGVVAPDIETVISEVKKHFPDPIITQICHRGGVDFIAEKGLVYSDSL